MDLRLKLATLEQKYRTDMQMCNDQLTLDFKAYQAEPSNLDLRDSVRMLQGQIGVYECIIEQLSKINKEENTND